MSYGSFNQTGLAYRPTPWVKRLLIANGVVFLVTMVAPDFFLYWFAFAPQRILTQPWGVVTYMFLHGNMWHLLINMLVLFFFGPPLESRWGSWEFVKFYFICGLGGVALSFLFASYSMVGASAAIYGLMLAFAMNWPNAPIHIWGIFPVKAKWLVGFLFALSLMNAVGGADNGVAHFAHLGGILAGFLYLRSDWWRSGSTAKGKKRKARIRRMAVVSRDEKGRKAAPDQPASENWDPKEGVLLDEVDRILDKISAEGMGALTEDERKVLDEVSRRHRTN
jgi:membrane associated rhomboid family serine protease